MKENIGGYYQSLKEEDQRLVSQFVSELVDHFIRHNNKDFVWDSRNGRDELPDAQTIEASQERLLEKVDRQLEQRNVPEYLRLPIKEQFVKFRYGYYVIDSLLSDEDISDIKIYDYNDIRIKRLGVRYRTQLRFVDRRDYTNFVSLVMTRNGVGQSDNNAIVKFTDTQSNPMFRLRFDIMTTYVTSTKAPYVHIRLIPKRKRNLEELEQHQMFPTGTRDYITNRLAAGDGLLVTGKNGSGKTTLVNALMDVIHENKSVMVIEDNQELFSETRGEIYFTHSIESRSEGKITYGMTDLAEEGLLADIDVMIVGEVKNDSAKGLMKAAYVGVQPITTSHGQSAKDGYYKLADYVKQATSYEFADCLRFLLGFRLLIFMKSYKVYEIVQTTGWDRERNEPSFRTIYDQERGGWLCDVDILEMDS